MPSVGLAVRAVRRKVRLMTAFGTVGPAAWRGLRLLAGGRFGAFARKLLNEADDVRADIARPPYPGRPLFLAGHVLGHGGYDQVVFALLKGLTAAGLHVCRDPRALLSKAVVPPDLRPAEATRRPADLRLAVCPPHHLARFRPDGRTVAFTMWETDQLPTPAVEALNRCGLVLVPSKWGAACFRANGVTVPTDVVPLGYDPAVFAPGADAPGSSVTFGTAGALDEGGVRKNVQRVIDLFRRAFPKECGVRLRVKITPTSPMVRTDGDDRIEVTARTLTPAELADWYRSLTAFVNASAGEGFGLHLLEANACGVPLVTAGFGGVSGFFDPAAGYAVPYALVPAAVGPYRGRWADPDPGGLMAAMRQVWDDPDEAARRGAKAARRAARFTWDDTARKVVIALIQRGFIRPDGGRSDRWSDR